MLAVTPLLELFPGPLVRTGVVALGVFGSDEAGLGLGLLLSPGAEGALGSSICGNCRHKRIVC